MRAEKKEESHQQDKKKLMQDLEPIRVVIRTSPRSEEHLPTVVDKPRLVAPCKVEPQPFTRKSSQSRARPMRSQLAPESKGIAVAFAQLPLAMLGDVMGHEDLLLNSAEARME